MLCPNQLDFTVTAGALGNLDAPLNTQPPRAYSDIFGDIGGRLGQRIIGAENWLVCQFWLSEGRPGLDSRVGDAVNPSAVPLPTTSCAKLLITKVNQGTSRWALLLC